MYANPEREQCAPENLSAIQWERLQKTLSWAQAKSVFYKKRFEESGLHAADVQSLGDIAKLPFTQLGELQQVAAQDFLTLPYSQIARISYWEHPRPMLRMYTAHDVAVHVDMAARVLVACGVVRGSIAGILGDMADSALMDLQSAAELLGVTLVPLGAEYDRVMRVMEQIGCDVLIGSSRRILRWIVQLQAAGKDVTQYPLKRVLSIGEALSNPLRGYVERRLDAPVYTILATGEFGCIGMLYQCDGYTGHHFQEDYFYPEIIAFGGDEVITEPDRMGELVITSLVDEAMPIIRGRTGQAVTWSAAACTCGRTLRLLTTPLSFGG